MNNNFVIFGVLVLVLIGGIFAFSGTDTDENNEQMMTDETNSDNSQTDNMTEENNEPHIDHHLEMAEVQKDSDSLTADFTSLGMMPLLGESGAVGYGLITGKGTDEVIVSTTHAGVLDSETQEDALDPVWHNHIVKLGAVAACGENPGVIDITFESPGEVSVRENGLVMANVPAQVDGTHSLTSEKISFAPGTDVQSVVQFSLEPKFSTEEELQAVCVTDIEEVEFTLI